MKSNDNWQLTDRAATIVRLVGASLALVAAAYAVKPIVYNFLGLSRVSEIRNAKVRYSLSSGKGEYTVEVRKLRPECPIISLHLGATIKGRPHHVKLSTDPYQLSGAEGWINLRFDATLDGVSEVGTGKLYGTANYKCPEGKVVMQLPLTSIVEVVK